MVTALRPMSLGELLDRTFYHYRSRILVFAGIMGLPALTFLPFNLMLQALQLTTGIFTDSTAWVMVPLILVMAVAGFFVYGAALGATTFAVSELHLGRSVTIRSAFAKVRPHIGRLALLILGLMIRGTGIVLLVGGLAGGFSAVIGLGVSPVFAVAGVFLGFLVGGILFFVIFLRYSVCVPALVLEGLSARNSIKRSIQLSKDNLGRAFVIAILGAIIAYATMFIFQMPFMIVAVALSDGQPEKMVIWMQAATLFGSVGTAFSGPIMMIAFALFYYDLRVRKEAFDLELMMSAIDGTPPPGAPPAVPEEPAGVVPRQFP